MRVNAAQRSNEVTDRVKLVSDKLGFDPTASFTFRSGVMIPTPLSNGFLLSHEASLTRINASPYVSTVLKDSDVYIRAMEAASNRFIADRNAFLSVRTLRNIAADADSGIAIMTRHATGGFLGVGSNENPYGRTFAGHVDVQGTVTRNVLQYYMLRDYYPNGKMAPSTDDLNKGIAGGTIFDTSVGLAHGGEDLMTCNVCSEQLFGGKCEHVPGTFMNMTDEQIAASIAMGVPRGPASFTLDDWHAGETSFVYNGAVPNAGTAFGTSITVHEEVIEVSAAPSALASAPEDNMWTKEMKVKLGLAETATDEECVTAFNQLSAGAAQLAATSAANATRVKELEAAAAVAAEATFVTKFTGKLSAEVIESIKALPNREALAEQILKAHAPATPPVGDPLAVAAAALAGSSAAAAPGRTPANTETPESAIFRRGLGKFKTNAELEEKAKTKPLAAMEKMLGVTLHPTDVHYQNDEQSVANRIASYNMTP
jgi:hypothetical protein